MGFKCGIVGLPNVGKSTLFNALTKAGIPAANYPFCTIKPNVGIVPVPDERLIALATLVKPQKITLAHMEFIDIAGLVAGAAKGEGLGNQFLAHIREVVAIAHVVRCFEHSDIVHVSGKLDPIADIQVINTELALADLESAEKALLRLGRADKTNGKLAQKAKALLERVIPLLNQGQPLRLLSLTLDEQMILRQYQFLTSKPVLYIANVGEKPSSSNRWLLELESFARREHAPVTVLCARLEEDCADLTPEERKELLGEFSLRETGLMGLIRAGYALLGLQTFFTAGVQEVRAWTVSRGATAPQAAACIHSDFERGFIRAEVIGYTDFIRCGGVQGAREAGKLRLEGKTYQVQDGDVIHFLFNV